MDLKTIAFIPLLIFMQSRVLAQTMDQPALMPVPSSVEWQDGKFGLDSTFHIAVQGNPDERIYKGATSFLRRLDGKTGRFFEQNYVTDTAKTQNASLVITVNRPGKVKLHEDESYQVKVTPSRIHLEAKTDLGALHGLETLLQLVQGNGEGYYFPAVTIDDEPRFPWRGILLDVCRHFMPMEVIKRNLDAMAAMKMNVLHLHLTEDQGFRVESKTHPKLHQLGSDGKYYTQEQIREIINYAKERGIRVVPEFDMPGHATSWLVGYPGLASSEGPFTIERHFGIMEPVMDPTNEYLYGFLDDFYAEMASLFPDEYMHIGGDEVEGTHWEHNPEIQEFMEEKGFENNLQLQNYFNQRLLDILTKHDKKMIGWDEILQPELPKNAVIQSWRGKESLFEAANQGYQTILSNGYYIDLMRPASHHYTNDPLPADNNLSPEAKNNILGGEATMWSELVTPENIDSRLWPRSAAIAERLWSPREVNNERDMYNRLEKISIQLEDHGLKHLTYRRKFLRRLTQSYNITPLKNLVDVIEPLKGYERHQNRTYTTYSPLTMIMDAAGPDAKKARHFRWGVNDYLENPTEQLRTQMRHQLETWAANHRQLAAVIDKNPVLSNIRSLSQDLSGIANIGLQALDYRKQGTSPPNSWINESQTQLENARQPRANTELMIVDAIEKLVDAVH